MSDKNRQITLAARPKGMPKESDLKMIETDRPAPGDGDFLVRINYLSVDPYMRPLMAGGAHGERLKLGSVMPGGAAGRVIQSRNNRFKEGDVVVGDFGWQEYAISNGNDVECFDTSLAPMTTALGVLGMTGMTAYLGLLEIGRPKDGETVFVTAAAGAVGSTVAQIAKIHGCRVVGCAGSDEKVAYLLGDLRLDAAFNYKTTSDVPMKLKETCPFGIDVFFDNVGGPVSDAVFAQINTAARIVVCGQIDLYNATESPKGPRLLLTLLARRARAEGFQVFQFADRFPEARSKMIEWLRDGKLTHRETIYDGLESAPKAFIGLFTGANIGKTLVRIVEE